MRHSTGRHGGPPRSLLPAPLRKVPARLLPGALLVGSAAAVAVPVLTSSPGEAATAAPAAPVTHQSARDRLAAIGKPLLRRSAVRHHRAAALVTVAGGDTLSALAQSHCGSAAAWPHLYAANRHQIGADPDLIVPGQALRMWCHQQVAAQLVAVRHPALPAAAPAARPARTDPWDGQHHACGDGDRDGFDMPCSALHSGAPPAGPVRSEDQPAAQPAQPAAQPAPVAVSGMVNSSGMSAFQSCVISRESGGNPGAVNASSGAGGLYQFLPSTWAALGFSGSPQDAPVSVQNAAFAKAFAQSGTSPWAPYDGC